MEKAQVYAKHLKARVSAKKVAPVMDLVRGKNIKDAKIVLSFDSSKPASLILKVLKSAESNAKNNNKLKPETLYISELWVGPGETYKRMRIGSRSHTSPIFKRTSNIYLGLSERK